MKSGFTMAEVLITLGVIGIVAAMTMPQLISSFKKKETVEKLKVAYSIFSQAVETSKEFNGDISGWDMSLPSNQGASIYLLPYLNVQQTLTNTNSSLDKNYRHSLSKKDGLYLFWTWNMQNEPVYILSNGFYFVYKYGNGALYVVVDINGNKSPNVVGIDTFSFNIDKTYNRLIPTGYGKSRDVLLGNSGWNEFACRRDSQWEYYRGGSCAALIMMDGWKISDDYPWGNGGRSK